MRAVYGAGTAYVLTETPALINLGTTPPSIKFGRNTTWTLLGRAVIDLSGCTFNAPVTVTIKLRRTSGTPADLANSSTVVGVGIIGTSGTNEVDIPIDLPPVQRAVGAARETIELWASVSALPASGELRITEASIVAL